MNALSHEHQSSKYVYVKQVTWFRDSHGLFDYDAISYTESDAYVEESVFINRDLNDLIRVSEYNLESGIDDTFRSELEGCKSNSNYF